MSPEDECLLLHEVVPRLRSAIRLAVSDVGSEDGSRNLEFGSRKSEIGKGDGVAARRGGRQRKN